MPAGQATVKTDFVSDSFWLRLAGSSRNVGAVYGALKGIGVFKVVILTLFFIPQLGGVFSQITYKIASVLPPEWIPSDMYVPGQFVAPLGLLLAISGALYGGWRGSTPPETYRGRDESSSRERIYTFLGLIIIVSIVVYFRVREDYPQFGFYDVISHPPFVILMILIVPIAAVWVNLKEENVGLMTFFVCLFLVFAFTAFLLFLTILTFSKIFLAAIN